MPNPTGATEDQHASALDAFVRFTEVAGTSTDVHDVARHAIDALMARFHDASVGYYERHDHLWKATVHSDNAPPELLSALRAGLHSDLPIIAEMLRTRDAVFIDEWTTEEGSVEHTEVFDTTSVHPVLVDGQVFAFLSVEHKGQRRQTEQDQAFILAVGRTVTRALEHAAITERLAERNAELDARNRALSAFEEWSRDLTLDADPTVLIRRAQVLLHELLPTDAAAYYEKAGDRWYVKFMQGAYGNEDLRRAHEAGLLHSETDSLRVPFETGEACYQDTYDPQTDKMADGTRHVSATAMLPLRTLSGVRGIFGVARFGPGGWSTSDRTVIETVRRSLELALDRADKVAELEAEREALQQGKSALAAANEELEAFAYSVSHDLRTPVRHITGFNALLRKSLGELLDPKAERYLTVLNDAAERMNVLIDAMLNLSRTSRQPLHLGLVDVGALVKAVRAELQVDVIERDVTWRVAELPLVTGDHGLLRQVLVNLLSNALKYTATRDETVIEVWAEERKSEWAFFVRDNGAGFDMRYVDKLFGVFQRLHRAEEFEGTGVGLANVRRIITRHGGAVSAVGAPGEGATFSFTLPKPA